MGGILFEGTDQDIFWQDGNTTVTTDVSFLYQYLNWVAPRYRRLYGESVFWFIHSSVVKALGAPWKYTRTGLTGLWVGYPRNCNWIPRRGTRFFSPPQPPDPLTRQPSLFFNGQRCYLPGVKWSVREADHSPPISAEKEINGDILLF